MKFLNWVVLEKTLILTFFLGLRNLFIFLRKDFTRCSPVEPIYGRFRYTGISPGSSCLSVRGVSAALTNLSINFVLTLRGKPFQEANLFTFSIPSLKLERSQSFFVLYTKDRIHEILKFHGTKLLESV